MQRILLCLFIITLFFGFKNLILPSPKKQPSTVHKEPLMNGQPILRERPLMRLVRIVTVNEHNVFKHIVLPEECGELSKDPLHPDRLQAWQRNDTLYLGFRKYKK